MLLYSHNSANFTNARSFLLQQWVKECRKNYSEWLCETHRLYDSCATNGRLGTDTPRFAKGCTKPLWLHWPCLSHWNGCSPLPSLCSLCHWTCWVPNETHRQKPLLPHLIKSSDHFLEDRIVRWILWPSSNSLHYTFTSFFSFDPIPLPHLHEDVVSKGLFFPLFASEEEQWRIYLQTADRTRQNAIQNGTHLKAGPGIKKMWIQPFSANQWVSGTWISMQQNSMPSFA